MEIDFMILWKKNAKEKKNLLLKVIEMIETVFPEAYTDHIIINSPKNIEYVFPYKVSVSKDDIAYLKIECNYSEMMAAKYLSLIRDEILQKGFRSYFSIICTFDEASLSFCCKLMKPFGIFERRLREIMYLTTVKAFGYDWVAISFPKELLEKIKEKTHGLSDEKLTELAFEYLDYSEITDYLFAENRKISLDVIVDIELSDDHLNSLSKNEIINILKKARKESLWNELFAGIYYLPNIEETIDRLRGYRNDIMHHHRMDEKTYAEVRKELKNINVQLTNAIKIMESRIYSKDEYEIVLPNLGQLAYKMIEAINSFFDSSLVNAAKAALDTVAKIAKSSIIKSIPDLTPLINNLPQMSQIGLNQITDIKLPIEKITSIGNISEVSIFDGSDRIQDPPDKDSSPSNESQNTNMEE